VTWAAAASNVEIESMTTWRNAMDMGMMNQSMGMMPGMDMMSMQRLIDAASACEQACTMCSGSMSGMADMDRCGAMCATCAEMCNTTMRMMLRPNGRHLESMMAMLQACMTMCMACADECVQHTDMQVCQMCASACREMASACEAMMASMQTMDAAAMMPGAKS
jgi:hypothetical protein